MKKIFSILTIFSLITSSLPFPVFAQTATDSSLLNQASSSAQAVNQASSSAIPGSSSPFNDEFIDSSLVPVTGFTGPSASSLLPNFDSLNSQPIANIIPVNTKWTIAGNTKHDLKGDETYRVNVNDISPQNVQAEVFDSNGKQISVDFQKLSVTNGTSITILPPKNFKPGKYSLKITDASGNTQTQDFTWGVLAINTNKSIYLPSETANLAMAVLDDTGVMVCDANVKLEIRNPKSETTILSTDNGLIKVNPECQIHDYTERPDYEANYQTSNAGTYNMTLTANTKNGIRTITDSFQVQNSVPFDVERQTGTRIFPPATYPVNFNIKINQDFKGQIIEYVPNSFTIYPSTNSAASIFDVKQIATPVKNETGTLSSLNISLPFNGIYNETLGFGQRLIDSKQKDLYQKFGLLGHDGLDFEMPIGTPVLAADEGTVVMAGGEIYGTTVVIQHSWGRSYYGHLSRVNAVLGQTVTKGQEIALSGNTGLSTGPHLHFSIKLNSNDPANGFYGKIDPSLYLDIQSQPQITASNINDMVKAIVWNVDAKKGDTLNLSYAFVAPSVSPQFYTLGPLSFVEKNQVVFQEARLWQLAVDAVTRFYLPSTGTSPLTALTADAGWEDTSIITRNKLITTKISSAFASDSFNDNNAASKDILFRQYVSDPIAAQTISAQTLKFQIRSAIQLSGNSMLTSIGVRVVSNDGSTVRGTILAVTRDATALTSTLTNRQFTATTTEVIASANDRIVIEIGTGGDPSGGNDHDTLLRVGDASASDLSEDDTSTTDNNPWVEFANAITFETSPTVALNTPADAATNQSTTPTLNFTGTDAGGGEDLEYNVQISDTTAFSLDGDIDQQHTTGTLASNIFGGTGGTESEQAYGQSFTAGSSYNLERIDIKIAKIVSPGDNVNIYVKTGSITGTIVGTSDSVASSSLVSDTPDWHTFNFSTPVSITSGTKYYFTIERSGTRDSTNYYRLYGDFVDYAGGGSYTKSNNVWGSESGSTDQNFKTFIPGTAGTVFLDKFSTTDAGFTAGHPFASGVAKDFTVQAADTLTASTTYYWRVAAIDPSGSNTYGAWSSTRSFTTGEATTPTLSQLMRHGKWFNAGVEQPFTF